MIPENIKIPENSQSKNRGGFFSQFHLSSGAALLQAFAKLIDSMKELEKFFNELSNDSIQGQVISSSAAAQASEKSLKLEADGMKKQAIAGLFSAGSTLALTGLDTGASTLASREADGLNNDIETTNSELSNAQDYKSAYLNRPTQVAINEKGEMDTNSEAQAMYEQHISHANEVVQSPIDAAKETPHINNADKTKANEAVEAFDKVIEEKNQQRASLQDQQRAIRNKFDQIQNTFGMLRSFASDLPNSIGGMLSAEKKKEQAVQEALKTLLSSTEQINKSLESRSGQEYNTSAQMVSQLSSQYEQLTSADGYRGG